MQKGPNELWKITIQDTHAFCWRPEYVFLLAVPWNLVFLSCVDKECYTTNSDDWFSNPFGQHHNTRIIKGNSITFSIKILISLKRETQKLNWLIIISSQRGR